MMSAIDADPRSMVVVGRPTTTKTRVVARVQQLVRVDEEEDADLEGEEVQKLLGAVKAAVSIADAVVLEDYNKGVLVPLVFFFNDAATTEIYTLSLHDALPI